MGAGVWRQMLQVANRRSEHDQPFQIWLNSNQQIKIGLADAFLSTNPTGSSRFDILYSTTPFLKV
jgi:hypothetical protein